MIEALGVPSLRSSKSPGYASIEAVYERTTDPVTLSVLADELADLLTERGAILCLPEAAL
ncbi:hypothetical protein [Streptomyces sp. NPDC101455]|uniref:hypothetical protein n=1 Tax=Streptomyces sp. NPDC101455 TaxID=3366142 RepID=UPI0037F7B8AC